MTIDWSWLEMLVVKHAETALGVFAKMHPDETFYGAIVFAAPYDGVAFELLLNTPEHATPGQRFLPAAFRYHIDIGDTIEQWSDIADAIEEAMDSDIEQQRVRDGDYTTAALFRDVACRVALRLELGALTKLARTADFAISVTGDAREPGELALGRYAAFKKRAALGVPDASS